MNIYTSGELLGEVRDAGQDIIMAAADMLPE